MRQLRRILRLHYEGSSTRDIVRVTGIARTTVQRALERSKAAKLVWPLADEVSDALLEERLAIAQLTQDGLNAQLDTSRDEIADLQGRRAAGRVRHVRLRQAAPETGALRGRIDAGGPPALRDVGQRGVCGRSGR